MVVGWAGVVGVFAAVSAAKEVSVTFGSVIKLKAVRSSRYLQSLPAQWSEGRQVVTGSGNRADPNSYWQVLPVAGAALRSEIACDSNFRLQHVSTQNWLHLSAQKSEISGNAQVVASSSLPATVLRVRCEGGKVWRRGSPVEISDSHTSSRLGLSGVEYSQRNCPNCVINGDLEVAHAPRLSDASWVVEDGILFADSLDLANAASSDATLHDEL